MNDAQKLKFDSAENDIPENQITKEIRWRQGAVIIPSVLVIVQSITSKEKENYIGNLEQENLVTNHGEIYQFKKENKKRMVKRSNKKPRHVSIYDLRKS